MGLLGSALVLTSFAAQLSVPLFTGHAGLATRISAAVFSWIAIIVARRAAFGAARRTAGSAYNFVGFARHAGPIVTVTGVGTFAGQVTAGRSALWSGSASWPCILILSSTAQWYAEGRQSVTHARRAGAAFCRKETSASSLASSEKNLSLTTIAIRLTLEI